MLSEERFIEIGNELAWRVGKTKIQAEYDRKMWNGIAGGRKEDRLVISVIRRF